MSFLDNLQLLNSGLEKFNSESTMDIYKKYVHLEKMINSYSSVFKANYKKDVADAFVEISGLVADIINDVDNYFILRPDEQVKACLRDLSILSIRAREKDDVKQF